VLDETGLWTPRNGGVKLANTIRRNVAKMDGRTWETTNSYEPGEDSVAERTDKAVEAGAVGIMIDAVEADPIDIDAATDAELVEALRKPYGDSYWVYLPRLVDEIRDPDMPREDVERYYFNWNRKGGGKAVDPKRWDWLADTARVVEPGERIGLGFDGAISHDCVALIACTYPEIVDEGLVRVHLFVPTYAGEPTIWSRPVNAPRDWRYNRTAIEDAVARLHATYSVGRQLCDPPRWQSEIERWAELYGDDVVAFFDTNQPTRMARACDRWDTIVGKAGDPTRALTHDGHPLLRSHVTAMIRRKAYLKHQDESDGRTRYVFDKGPDGRHIDGGIASVLAVEAAATMPPKPRPLPPPDIF
jgi:hypothetical protein